MKTEQKAVATYTFVGVLGGIISNYLTSISVILALVVPAALCVASLVLLRKISKEKKTKKIIANSIFTFFLVWMTVWIFLFNM